MYDRILVPTDGSEVAASAAHAAIALAEAGEADLHAIHAPEAEPYPFGFEDATAELARHGEAAVEKVATWATEAGVDATTSVIDDAESVPGAILSYAAEHDIDLAVLGTHGRSGVDRLLLGSVTELTLRDSPVPVLTVREETAAEPPFGSILVPFDGSAGASGALEHAIDLAADHGAGLYALTVIDHGSLAGGGMDTTAVHDALRENSEQALETVAERAAAAGVSVEGTAVTVGSPAREILAYADEHGVDCVVMGTRGRSGLGRVLLGSVTERVVRQAGIPVVVTTAPDEPADD